MLKICFISMKGGTGKTTLSLLFTYFMADRGKNVFIDGYGSPGKYYYCLC